MRSDLNVVLEQGICQQPQNLGAWLQEQGVFDAGVVASLHKPSIDVRSLAFSYARKRHHEGLAWGLCPDQSVWIVTTPAPAPLDHVELTQWCSRSSWEVALVSGDIRKTTRRRSPFEKGSTGVYCWRKGFENQGPVLWYLVETQKVDADVFGVDDQASQPEVWLSWVNALRREYGVAAVTLEPSDWMEPLFHPGRLYHDHQSLVALDAHLRKQFHLRMIGENRVAGKSLSSLMKQMWSSPRHRKLLIAPQAQKMAIKQQSGFAVLMMLKEAF